MTSQHKVQVKWVNSHPTRPEDFNPDIALHVYEGNAAADETAAVERGSEGAPSQLEKEPNGGQTQSQEQQGDCNQAGLNDMGYYNSCEMQGQWCPYEYGA